LNLYRLQHFIEVVDSESLSKAAKRMNLSQPALSKSIQRLEEELGVSLFDRLGCLELTPMGQALLPHARSLINLARDTETEMARRRDGELGELKLACGPTAAEVFVAPAVAEISRTKPKIKITAHVLKFSKLPGLLLDGKVEIAIAELEVFAGNPEFEIIPLPSYPIVFFGRAGHPLAGRRSVEPGEFFSYPVAAQPLPKWVQLWMAGLKNNSGGSAGNFGVSFECSNHSVLNQVVAASNAVSGAPLPIVEPGIRNGQLALINLRAPELESQTCIAHLSRRSLSPSASLLIEILRKGV
jgi:DNA-binding transcriptional LysR family regulator